MKKVLIALLLVAASVTAQAQASPTGQQQKKVIQDSRESGAYVAAINAADPAQKANLLENYLQTYPNSVMTEDGLELLIKTYQQLNNAAQMKSAAQRVLQVNPNNVTALVVLTYLDHTKGQENGADAAAALQEAGQYGARCVQALQTAPKPEGNTDEQWAATKNNFRILCQGAVGHAALAAEDYPAAQQILKDVVAAQPTDVTSIYQLALSYLLPKPPVVDGLFWAAKAAASAPQLLPYAKNQYVRYHGSEAGFDEMMAIAKTAPTIPARYSALPQIAPLKLPSTYISAQSPADKLQLNSDNSFSFQEAGQPYHGRFVLIGDTVELTISETGTTTTLHRHGNDLTDSSGQTWSYREQSAGTTPS
jgi:tetratricopeptide (TPR) repeat protein